MHSLIYSFSQQMIIESANNTDKNPCPPGVYMLLGGLREGNRDSAQTLVSYVVCSDKGQSSQVRLSAGRGSWPAVFEMVTA